MTTDRSLIVSSTRNEAAHAEVRVGDLVTKYLRAGLGRAVVFLRESSQDAFFSALMHGMLDAGGFRVVAPEVPTELADFDDWLGAFLDGLGLLHVDLVSDASLAANATAFARAEPELVGRLVLVSRSATDVFPDLPAEDLLSSRLLVIVQGTPAHVALSTITYFLSASGAGPAKGSR